MRRFRFLPLIASGIALAGLLAPLTARPAESAPAPSAPAAKKGKKKKAAPAAKKAPAMTAEQLAARLEAVERELRELKARPEPTELVNKLAAVEAEVKRLKESSAADKEALTNMQATVDSDKEANAAEKETVAAEKSGNTKFIVAGYGFATYNKMVGENRDFSIGFNPIFIWKLTDRIQFTGEAEYEMEDFTHASSFNIETANVSIILNDYMTVVAGKYLTPFSEFKEHYHPAWINKSVDQPMYEEGDARQVSTNSFGVQLRGGIPLGSTRLKYALWVENGPSLKLDPADPGTIGTLAWEDFWDTSGNNNATIGGHLWFLPIPNLQMGFGVMSGRPAEKGSGYDSLSFTMKEADLKYQLDADPLKGRLDFRGEWAQTRVSDADYSALGVGPFHNVRSGGYGQFAYRPTKADTWYFKNFEPVVRYDWLQRPFNDPNGFNEHRWTYGLNYYLAQSTVLKAGYQTHHVSDPLFPFSTHGFLMNLAVGF